MSKEEDIIRVFDETTKALGPITHFVHSAGVGGKNSRLDVATAATIREVLDINLFGALICSREAVRRMSTTHGGKGGSIVLLSSIAAVTGGATEYVFYAAAKGGIDALTNGLAREVALEGVRVNAIRPGLTDTEIHEPGRVCAHHAAVANEAARPSRTKSPKPLCFCCRMRRPTSPERCSMFRADVKRNSAARARIHERRQ